MPIPIVKGPFRASDLEAGAVDIVGPDGSCWATRDSPKAAAQLVGLLNAAYHLGGQRVERRRAPAPSDDPHAPGARPDVP